jgi:Ca-activated chloride channel family protein
VVQDAIARLIPSLGTSLGQGMLAALEAIAEVEGGVPPEWYSNRSPAPEPSTAPVEPGSHDSAAIVLLTDGENTTDPEPLEVAMVAAQQGIAVHTVGVGTVEGTTLDLDGFQVHTRLDVAMLEAVAQVTAGTYHPGTDAADSLDAVYQALGRRLTMHEEHLEITALLAAAGLVLLALGGVTSLLLRGRLP